jgi:LysM repeat protein
MTKRFWMVIGSVLVLMVLLSGCNLSASDAPATPTSQGTMPTPIQIKTDAPISQTQTAIAEAKDLATPTATLEPTTAVQTTPTSTPTPTEEPTEAAVVPTLTRPAEYTLEEGEFPYCIARRFDLNPEDLLDLNDLEEDELVRPGTTLQIPQTGSWVEGSRARNPHPTTHTVKSGETVYSIACYYGDVSPEAIIAVNNLQEPYTLTAGQTLQIP